MQARKSALAKVIRLSIRNGVAILTSPPGISLDRLNRFLESKKTWIEKHLNFTPPPAFHYGQTLTILGAAYLLKQDVLRPRHIAKEDGILWIGAAPPLLHSLLITFLKKEAHTFFTQACHHYAQQIGVSFQRITIRDAKTRWGSCSSQGSLNFNWRLTLAPRNVAAYIAAHEVAHLKEMNHSPKFWKIVEHLDPTHKASREWIKKNGKMLMGY